MQRQEARPQLFPHLEWPQPTMHWAVPSKTTDSGNGTTIYSYNQNDVLITNGPAPVGKKARRAGNMNTTLLAD